MRIFHERGGSASSGRAVSSVIYGLQHPDQFRAPAYSPEAVYAQPQADLLGSAVMAAEVMIPADQMMLDIAS